MVSDDWSTHHLRLCLRDYFCEGASLRKVAQTQTAPGGSRGNLTRRMVTATRLRDRENKKRLKKDIRLKKTVMKMKKFFKITSMSIVVIIIAIYSLVFSTWHYGKNAYRSELKSRLEDVTIKQIVFGISPDGKVIDKESGTRDVAGKDIIVSDQGKIKKIVDMFMTGKPPGEPLQLIRGASLPITRCRVSFEFSDGSTETFNVSPLITFSFIDQQYTEPMKWIVIEWKDFRVTTSTENVMFLIDEKSAHTKPQ